MRKELVIGISCFYHDSAIAVIADNEIIFCVQEERLSRKKNDSAFPVKSVRKAMDSLNFKLEDVSAFIFYEKPLLKFERIIENYLYFSPKGYKAFSAALLELVGGKFFLKREIVRSLKKIDDKVNFEKKIFFCEHHLSHLASSYYPSPFQKSLLVSLDGVGESSTTTIARGVDNKIEILEEMHYPNSLGLLYSAFTYFLGFKINDGEYKMMGLAPYGKPTFYEKILDHLIDLKKDGSFKINLEYFNFTTGLTMTNEKFNNLFKCKPRKKDEKIEQIHMNLAASIQKITEKIILDILEYAKDKYDENNLCLSGGVALNCVANGKVISSKLFNNIWIQPASGDAGGALGAALYFCHSKKSNIPKSEFNPYLGPEYSTKEITDELNSLKAKYTKVTEEELLEYVSDCIKDQKIIGWFQNKLEFGPRALGNRSIIADPRNEKMQKILNLKTKFRESFRPFAPAVLEEESKYWFEMGESSPYMLLVSKVKDDKLIKHGKKITSLNDVYINKSLVPAITHVDNTARIQTVNYGNNPKFYKLIKKFFQKTGCPILINTSFNINNEPIVCSPTDAYKSFLKNNIDILIIDNFILLRNEQYQKF